jgi:hypothetical protein
VIDGEIVFVAANMVAYLTVPMETLEVIRLTKAVDVGCVVRDGSSGWNTIELRRGDYLAGACARCDLLVVEDRCVSLWDGHHRHNQEEKEAELHCCFAYSRKVLRKGSWRERRETERPKCVEVKL